MVNRKPVVLFLCRHNSGRSQIAEALLRHYAGEHYEVCSAGLDPSDEIHPLAERVMNEVGIDVSGQAPKSAKLFMSRVPVRHAIIVCQNVEDHCPRLYPGSYSKLLWPFEDPAAFVGSAYEQLEVFRQVRDAIDHKIREWLQEQENLCLTH